MFKLVTITVALLAICGLSFAGGNEGTGPARPVMPKAGEIRLVGNGGEIEAEVEYLEDWRITIIHFLFPDRGETFPEPWGTHGPYGGPFGEHYRENSDYVEAGAWFGFESPAEEPFSRPFST